MKIDLDRALDLPVPANRAWDFLNRIEAVAACLPGAKITEKVDDTHYKGGVSVRLGPVALNFAGALEIVSRDAASRTIVLAGKGSDKGGGSVAEMSLTAGVVETGVAASRIEGRAGVTVNGKAAALGARMMDSVSEQLIKTFYANVLKTLAAEPASSPILTPTSAPAAAAADLAGAPAPQATPRPVAVPPATTPATEPQVSLNGFAFIWGVLKSFFAGLFSGKRVSS